jgi:hypothetical protein
MNRYTSVFEQSLMLEPDGEYVLYKDAQQAIATARAEAIKEAAERAVEFCSSWNINSNWLRAAILTANQEETPLAKRLVEVYNSRLTGCDCSRCILADKQEGEFADHDRYVYDDAKPADKQEEK